MLWPELLTKYQGVTKHKGSWPTQVRENPQGVTKHRSGFPELSARYTVLVKGVRKFYDQIRITICLVKFGYTRKLVCPLIFLSFYADGSHPKDGRSSSCVFHSSICEQFYGGMAKQFPSIC